MADPVTNIQIEDVLSSIRRLVAEGDRSSPASANPAPHMAPPAPATTIPAADSAPAPVAERFVLTPALRVTPEEVAPEAETVAIETVATESVATESEPISEPISEAIFEPIPEPAQPVSHRSSLEATIAELEAAVTGQPDEWEPDGSETVPVMDWSTVTPQDSVFVARNPTTLRLVPDAQVTEAAPEFTPESAPESTPEPIPEPAAEAEPEISFHRAHTDSRPEPTARAATDADLATDLSRDDRGDYADDLDPELANFLASDGVMDEETLRALVADIVRQELQGALGERITRNVRKLVRREIYRVLASQEFD